MASVSREHSCKLCCKTFSASSNIPRVLQCLHVFCEQCLEKLHDVENSTITCPTCTEVTQLNRNGVHGLPQEYAAVCAVNIIEMSGQRSSIPCHDCPDGEKAKFFCKDCNEFQCQNCRDHHLDKRNKFARHHTVIGAQNVTTDMMKSTTQQKKCHEHDQLLRFYCDKEGCKVPICVECIVFEHEKQDGHKICKLDEVFQNRKERIRSLTKHAGNELDKLLIREANEDKIKQIVAKQKEKALKEIKDEFDQLTETIKERKSRLEDEVERRYSSVTDEIDSRLNDLKKEQDKRRQAQSFSTNTLNHYTDVEFLTIDRTIQHRFDTLTQTFAINNPIRRYKLEYNNKLPRHVFQVLNATENCVGLDTESIPQVEVSTLTGVQNQRSKVAEIFFKDKDGGRLTVDIEDVKVTASTDEQELSQCEVEIEDDQTLCQVYLTAKSKGTFAIKVAVYGQTVEEHNFVEVQDEQEYEDELASEESFVQENCQMNTEKDKNMDQIANIDVTSSTTGLDGASAAEQSRKKEKPITVCIASERTLKMAKCGVPDFETQKKDITSLFKSPLKQGDTWYLLDLKWLKQWKKYVGYDSWDTFTAGEESAYPGPIDNSPLFKDSVSNQLREHLIDELDFMLIPTEGWNKLVTWYGLTEGQDPIARTVINEGIYSKNLKVEVHPWHLKLCEYSILNKPIIKEFSRSDTIEELEKVMRKEFSISDDKEVRLWKQYMSNTYEPMNEPEDTLQGAGLYQGQRIVIEQKNKDGTWPIQVKKNWYSPSSASGYSFSTKS